MENTSSSNNNSLILCIHRLILLSYTFFNYNEVNTIVIASLANILYIYVHISMTFHYNIKILNI
jgi:hypothetical protein